MPMPCKICGRYTWLKSDIFPPVHCRRKKTKCTMVRSEDFSLFSLFCFPRQSSRAAERFPPLLMAEQIKHYLNLNDVTSISCKNAFKRLHQHQGTRA